MERFRASRNQRFSSPPAMVGSRLGSLDNLCIPELGHYLVLSKFKSCFCPCNSSVRIIIIKSLAIVSWINVLERLFLLELKFYSVILLTFKYVHLIRDSLFFSVLKVETVEKLYLCETATKAVTQLFVYEKNWSAFSAAKKAIVYYVNWLVRTTKIICEKKGWRYSYKIRLGKLCRN